MRIDKEIFLFGQRDYGVQIQQYLKQIAPNITVTPLFFPLRSGKPDATQFDFSLHDEALQSIPKERSLWVIFSLKYHEAAARHLASLGFHNLCVYTPELDNELKKAFFAQRFSEAGKNFAMVQDYPPKSVEIYMAKSIYDKEIVNYPAALSPYIIPIQAGAALTAKRIADVVDSTGDNISSRNRRYSEMTVFYWMWKNARADYIGLCHYRRLWTDLDRIVEKLRTTDLDAVLPLPSLCEHSIHEDEFPRYTPEVWPVMMDVLREKEPAYYKLADKIYGGNILYTCNMCILKRRVLDDLCRWMFPVVMEIERRVGELEDPYYNRYAGFCTEWLITLYFLSNVKKWRLAHAERIFID